MATTTCPDGHPSEAADWCDQCGIAMTAAPTTPAGEAAGASSLAGLEVEAGQCPNCGTNRVEGEAFCEVCGLDFATGRLPEVASAASAETAETEAPATAGTPTGWTVVVAADREWFDRNEAESGRVVEFPDSSRPRTVDLSGDVVTIGRRDEGRGWFPDIDLGVPTLDPSTSRHHAELRRRDEGWILVDVGSTNGTMVDGAKVTAHEDVALEAGAVIHVGAFSRLVLGSPETAA